MRIYTNFDSWKMMAHNIPLGWINYKDENYNLDEKSSQIKLLNELISDEAINLWDKDNNDFTFNELEKMHFKFLTEDLKKYNYKVDGSHNKMQFITVLLNLRETTRF